jgi:hypothetical protein
VDRPDTHLKARALDAWLRRLLRGVGGEDLAALRGLLAALLLSATRRHLDTALAPPGADTERPPETITWPPGTVWGLLEVALPPEVLLDPRVSGLRVRLARPVSGGAGEVLALLGASDGDGPLGGAIAEALATLSPGQRAVLVALEETAAPRADA